VGEKHHDRGAGRVPADDRTRVDTAGREENLSLCGVTAFRMLPFVDNLKSLLRMVDHNRQAGFNGQLRVVGNPNKRTALRARTLAAACFGNLGERVFDNTHVERSAGRDRFCCLSVPKTRRGAEALVVAIVVVYVQILALKAQHPTTQWYLSDLHQTALCNLRLTDAYQDSADVQPSAKLRRPEYPDPTYEVMR